LIEKRQNFVSLSSLCVSGRINYNATLSKGVLFLSKHPALLDPY